MAHYDCSNCGHPMGIDFGMCDNCTPQEYRDIKLEIRDLYQQASEEWNKLSEKKMNAFLEEYMERGGLKRYQARLKVIEEEYANR